MPDCTPAERKFLDALHAEPDGNLVEIRAKLAISRVTPELYERLVVVEAAARRAKRAECSVWEEVWALGVSGKSTAFSQWYDRLQADAEARAAPRP